MGLFNKKTKQSEPDKVVEDKKVVEKKSEVKESSSAKASDDKEVKEVKKPSSSAKAMDDKEAKTVKKSTKPTSKKSGYGTAYSILLRPIISEKATMANSENKYIFEIDTRANKIEVKKAIEEVYGVTPQAINIINQRGKFVRFGRKQGRAKNTKKAIVTLKKGESITIYEGI